jgi:tripartite-type tricarboxylate transporter receptor subunit TctC
VAVAMPTRLHSLPNVPTSAEAGLPEFQMQGWNGLFAPKGTPQTAIDKLNKAMRTGVEKETYKKRLDELGAVTPSEEEMSPDYLARFVPQEIDKFRALLADGK